MNDSGWPKFIASDAPEKVQYTLQCLHLRRWDKISPTDIQTLILEIERLNVENKKLKRKKWWQLWR